MDFVGSMHHLYSFKSCSMRPKTVVKSLMRRVPVKDQISF